MSRAVPGAAWWAGRSARERALLGLLALCAATYLLVAGVARPLLVARASALAAIARSDAALARLEALPMDGSAPAAPVATRPVPAILTGTAPDFGLTILRIEPEGDGARLVLEDDEFARVLGWIEALETAYGLRLVALEMDRRPEPGIVGARLTLER